MLAQMAGVPRVGLAQPGEEAPVGSGGGQQLRGGGGRAQVPGRAGVDAAEQGFDEALGDLGAKARGDQVEHAHVAVCGPNRRTGQHQVERRPAMPADREDPGPSKRQQPGRGPEDEALGQGPQFSTGEQQRPVGLRRPSSSPRPSSGTERAPRAPCVRRASGPSSTGRPRNSVVMSLPPRWPGS